MFSIAIALGFIGSFHCVGMCGPIAMALPLDRSSKSKVVTGSILYNSGRLFTYAIFGLIVGFIGQGFYIAGYQNALSITIGSLILLFLLSNFTKWNLGNYFYSKFHFLQKIKSSIIQLFGRKSNKSLFLIGALNGLLPCGLVYLGIAGAIAQTELVNGMLFMLFFGLGTFPAMMTVNLISGTISLSFRNKIKKFVPFAIGVMAVLLIVRGLNLGIPWLSPKIINKTVVVENENGKTKSSTICVQDCCKE